jgi:hypothetical protein
MEEGKADVPVETKKITAKREKIHESGICSSDQ